ESNLSRQKILEIATTEMREILKEKNEEKVFFLYNENWAPGIIGLIAGRVADEFFRPVLAMTNCNGKIVGSGRSVEGLNITEHLNFAKEYLARFGGHAGACGFTLKDLLVKDDFEKTIKEKIENTLQNIFIEPSVLVEGFFDLDSNDKSLLDELEKFAPFGEGNPRPIFWLKDLTLASFEILGATGNHLRLMVRQNSPRLHKIMLFGKAQEFLPQLKTDQKIEALVEVSKNIWNGQVQREVRVVDLKIN
ncbi:MAG: DHHA1 domain-containing protein, partial [Patescibacteria group bacterium]